MNMGAPINAVIIPTSSSLGDPKILPITSEKVSKKLLKIGT